MLRNVIIALIVLIVAVSVLGFVLRALRWLLIVGLVLVVITAVLGAVGGGRKDA